MEEYLLERRAMVERQIAGRGICDARLLAALETIPRHLFVPFEDRWLAYQDRALAIGFGQTISQPYIVALMTDLLCLKGDERVLEVGTGSGYQAAVLSYLASEVYTIELDPHLAERAREVLCGLNRVNIHFQTADGSAGWPEAAPFNGILVTAFAPRVPRPLLEQLAEGGRLVLPVGPKWGQLLELWTRRQDKYEQEVITPVAFVPLRGKCGWKG